MEAESVQKSSFWSFKGVDEYVDSLFLMRCPFPAILILAAYLLFVLKIGPEYMKNRPAFKLRRLIIAYNAFQVAFSMYLTSYGLELILQQGLLERECFSNNRALFEKVTFGHNLYFIAKLTEFLDTIFFVLRKKWNQVTFLHVYHHFIMYSATWVTLKYEPTFTMVFLGTLNSFVHVIMYAYYGLAAFPKLKKYLWWKKYITKIQLIQFMTVMIQIQLNTFTSKCPASYIITTVSYIHGVLFIYLFTDFYIKSYKQKKKDNAALNRNKNEINKDGYKSRDSTSRDLKDNLNDKAR